MVKDIRGAIEKAAELARLEISDKEGGRCIDRAKNLIEYFEKLNELDTSRVEPTSHAIDAISFLREDKVTKFSDIKGIVDQFPEVEKPFVEVPLVVSS